MPTESPVAAEARPGLVCPGCFGVTLQEVLFTRQAIGRILRARKCSQCRRRVRTSEEVIAGTPQAREEAPAVS